MSFYAVFPLMFVTGLTIPLLLIEAVKLFEQKTNTKILSLMIGK